MRRILGVIVLLGFTAGALSAADTGPRIQMIDGKLSVQAEAVGLGRLLGLMDKATGMTSRVPPELAGRSISVRFSGLSVDDAVRKVFEGQSIDYVVIQGHGIIVTALSQARRDLPGSPPSPFPSAPAFQPPPEQPFVEESQPFIPPQPAPMPGVAMPGMPQPGIGMPGQQFPGAVPNGQFNGQQGQPAMIQTPFGPIPNPRANQPGVPSSPGQPGQQQNPFGGQQPFGSSVSPGSPGAPAQNPNLFGNTSPPIMNMGPNLTPQQQRRP